VRDMMEDRAPFASSSLPSSPRAPPGPGFPFADDCDESKSDVSTSDGDSVDDGLPEPRPKRKRTGSYDGVTTCRGGMAPHALLSTSDSPCTSPEPEEPEDYLFDFPAVPTDMDLGRQTSLDEDDLVNLLDCVQGIDE